MCGFVCVSAPCVMRVVSVLMYTWCSNVVECVCAYEGVVDVCNSVFSSNCL